MKKYLGVKIIEAEPAWKGYLFAQDGCDQSEQIIVKSTYENDNISTDWKDGYKVVYEDGYTSWSPKDVFEKAYKEVLKDTNDKLGLLIDPKTSEWEIIGHVAKMEMGYDNFKPVNDSDRIAED